MIVPTNDDLVDWMHDLASLTLPRVRALAAARTPPWTLSEKRIRKLRGMGNANAALVTPSACDSRKELHRAMTMKRIPEVETSEGLALALDSYLGTEATLLGCIYENNQDTLSWYYELYAANKGPNASQNIVVSSIFSKDVRGPVLVVKNGPAPALYSADIERTGLVAALWYYHKSGRDPKTLYHSCTFVICSIFRGLEGCPVRGYNPLKPDGRKLSHAMYPTTTDAVIRRIKSAVSNTDAPLLCDGLLFPTGTAAPQRVPVPSGADAYMPWLNPTPRAENITHEMVTVPINVNKDGVEREAMMTVLYMDQTDLDHPINMAIAQIGGAPPWRGNILVLLWDGEGPELKSMETADEVGAAECVKALVYDVLAAAQPFDVDVWVNVQEIEDMKRKTGHFECSICLETFYKPVLTLCIHRFCFACLMRWLRLGDLTCPYCKDPLLEPPIRDNGFEMELVDAITGKTVEKSPTQPGKAVAGRGNYTWDGIDFPNS
ncbi:hypothetical protein B0H15DRAFT_957687 [Mycena belliarum]|uniref:RING-type E3 ubiquitin transferase n=1 Tax=Mycena belliarum TaxID=1033014 RepID=A0AAD6TQM8_9AGAR|nr:hypothetical protein B0H15DRAFT_957687 [Mycena belliae]